MNNSHDWAEKWSNYSPNKIAFKEFDTDRSVSFLELNENGSRIAHYFSEHFDLKKGERVAVLAENSLEYIYLFVAAQKLGFILVPMNYRLAPAELDHVLYNSSPKLVLFENKYQQKLLDGELYGHVPHSGELKEIVDYILTNKKDDDPPVFNSIEPEDPIFILYTSGTTGFPKGAIYTHKMLFWNSVNTSMSLIVNTESKTINVMPPFHTGGWNVLTTPFFHHGGYTCICKNFDPSTSLKLIEKEKATIFMGVPTMLKMMADLPEFKNTDFSALKYIIVGGEPMPIPLIEKYAAKNVAIRQGYGMTEVGPNLTSLHQDDAIRKKGSIGRPNYYVQIKIVNEKGSKVGANESGELLLKGPMVTPGYWQNSEATKKAIVDEWFHTGDMVRQDEEGYLYVVDRIKNMFISGGENVYPAEVERVLQNMDGISETVVIGVSDERWGEVGKAFIVKNKELKSEEVLKHCRKNLAKFKVPKHIEFMDELPKNDTGKIDRKKLKGKDHK